MCRTAQKIVSIINRATFLVFFHGRSITFEVGVHPVPNILYVAQLTDLESPFVCMFRLAFTASTL